MARTLTDSVETNGTTAPLEQVDVRPRVTGFLESIHFTPRQKVERGALLFTVDQRPFQNSFDNAQAAVAMTRAQLDKAAHDVDRLRPLFETGAASDEELRDAISKRDSLAGSLAANEAKLEQARLELSWCEVGAPTAGRVSRQLVDPGNIVTADTTVLATIVNDDDVYVYFNVSERDILNLRTQWRQSLPPGEAPASQPELRDLKWSVNVGLMNETGHPHAGVLDYSAPTVDTSTGTQQVRGLLPNRDGVLLAGLFVRVQVPIGKPYEALTVTERALGSDQGQRFLLVVDDKNLVALRPVQIGALQEGLRVISAGLAADDWVIVNGMQRVRPGLTVKPIRGPMPTEPAHRSETGATQPSSVPATAPAPH